MVDGDGGQHVMPNVFLALFSLVLLIFSVRRLGYSPVTAAVTVLSGTYLALLLAPLPYYALSTDAALVLAAGTCSLVAVGLFPRSRARASISGHVTSGASRQVEQRASLRLVVLLSLLLLVAVALGYSAFTSGISAATNADYDQLSLEEVRRAQNTGARGGGLFALLGSLGPLLGCLGLYGARHHSKVFLLLPLVAVYVAVQNPSRLNSITLLVVLAVFYFYLRSDGRPVLRKSSQKTVAARLRDSGPTAAQSSRRRLVIVGLVSFTGAVVLFNAVGSALGKNASTAAGFPNYDWPAWTLSPVFYFTGSYPALTVALSEDSSPYDMGTSFYSLMRLIHVFDPRVDVPETIAQYSLMPVPFNLYSGFGQLFFDTGWIGLVLVCAALGVLVQLLHVSARKGSLPGAWACASLTSVLLAMPQSFLLFNLDVLVRLIVGVLVFGLLKRSEQKVSPASPIKQPRFVDR